MPCYEISTVQVDLNMTNFSLLKKAAEALGWELIGVPNVFSIRDGDILVVRVEDEKTTTLQRNLDKVNKLKQAYSKQALKHAAQKTGWTQKKEGKKLVFTKGGF